MLFTEPTFLLLYLPIVLALYYAAPHRARNSVLTVASLAFYAAGEWPFLPWLLASTGISYFITLGLDRWRGERRARLLLGVGIAIDLALLVVFKYAAFLTDNLNAILQGIGLDSMPVPDIALPLGISFFTFHKISYKIDVARGVAIVRRNPLDLFLYIALFPQLIAGPILRYHDVADELAHREQRLDEFAEGVRRFIIGFAKKLLVADLAARCADNVFKIPADELSTRVAWLGIVTYTIQIYADFSGYSDMAIGLARMFGFHFPENFNYPYAAISITDFWRRWHISLSRWFRDYLYIPLGGNRVSDRRTYLNLSIVFLLCGFWHGAKWTFVLWGAYHGGLQIGERIGIGAALERIPRAFRHGYTLLLVMIGWVLFRADTMSEAWAFLRAMFGFGATATEGHPVARYLDHSVIIALVVGAVISMPTLPAIRAWFDGRVERAGRTANLIDTWGHAVATAMLFTLFLLGAMQMAAAGYSPFIYFRF